MKNNENARTLLREKQNPTYYWEGECEDQPSSQHSQQQRQNSQSEPFLSHEGGQHGRATVLILPRRLLIKRSCVSISIVAPTGICLELNTRKGVSALALGAVQVLTVARETQARLPVATHIKQAVV